MGYRLDGQPVENSIRQSAEIQKASGSVTQHHGPILSVDPDGDVFILAERGKAHVVNPFWEYGYLRIGCTSITKEAFNKLREFHDDSDPA